MKDNALTLEKMEINKRIGEIEVLLASLKSRFEGEFGAHGMEGNIYRIFNDIKDDLKNLSNEIDTKTLVQKVDFDAHIVHDRWMFGILITMLVGIFIKLFFN